MAEEILVGPEIPGVPPEAVGAHREESVLPEGDRLRAREFLYMTELIRNPTVSPEVARIRLIHRIIFPSEEEGLEMSRWEANPTLREILGRAGEGEEARMLTEELRRQDSALADAEEKIERLKKESGSREEEIKALEKRIQLLKARRETTKAIIEASLSAFPEESQKWYALYCEVDAAIALQEIYLQREKAQQDVDTYAGKLFESPFFNVGLGTSRLRALFEQEKYGPALERALRAYIDLHLTGKIDGKEVRRLLQEKDCPPDEERKLVYEAVRQAVGGDPFVAKRAEILARHLLEISLLSVWLAVPRNEKGEIVYERNGKPALPEIGFGRLEGSSPTDLAKLVLFRLKYWAELNKNYPSFAGGMARWVPESLTPTLFHFMRTKEGKSVFEEWYFGKKPLAELLGKVPEDAFSSWVYFIYRQNNVRHHLLNFSRGGEKDCIFQLLVLVSVRSMKKDFDLGISDPLERLMAKINMIGCRIYAWAMGTTQGGEVATTAVAGEMDKLEIIKRGIFETVTSTHFLPREALKAVEEVISKGTALTPEEVLTLIPPEKLKDILAAKPPSQSVLERVSKADLEEELARVRRADKLVREISERRDKGEDLEAILKELKK